jgi:hypothetical protein
MYENLLNNEDTVSQVMFKAVSLNCSIRLNYIYSCDHSPLENKAEPSGRVFPWGHLQHKREARK